MFPDDNALTGDEGGGLLGDIADLITALGGAVTGVIGALRSGASGGVITVQQPPTSSGFGGGFDIVSLVLIGGAIWFIATQAR